MFPWEQFGVFFFRIGAKASHYINHIFPFPQIWIYDVYEHSISVTAQVISVSAHMEA